MSTAPQENQAQNQEQPKQNDKEYNFALIRQQLERERSEKQALLEELEKTKKIAQERLTQKIDTDDDDDSDEPYVDHKNLKKKFSKFEESIDQKIDQKATQKAQSLFQDYQKQQWMKNNPDFYDIMQHAQAFAERDPELAETILSMPEGFERQKLVYKNIKALGLHKKEEPKSGIQDKIDANRRSPYYQPSGVASAPYAAAGDFSDSGQANAYKKMQELKNRLRI